jgi:hypothetical protein
MRIVKHTYKDIFDKNEQTTRASYFLRHSTQDKLEIMARLTNMKKAEFLDFFLSASLGEILEKIEENPEEKIEKKVKKNKKDLE